MIKREREGGEGFIFEQATRKIEGLAGRRSCRGGMHTVEFIADESRKEGVEEGRSRGIGRGISRNIAAFSRAGAQNPPNRPCLSNNHIHTGHFPREQWSRYLFPAMIKGASRVSCLRRFTAAFARPNVGSLLPNRSFLRVCFFPFLFRIENAISDRANLSPRYLRNHLEKREIDTLFTPSIFRCRKERYNAISD